MPGEAHRETPESGNLVDAEVSAPREGVQGAFVAELRLRTAVPTAPIRAGSTALPSVVATVHTMSKAVAAPSPWCSTKASNVPFPRALAEGSWIGPDSGGNAFANNGIDRLQPGRGGRDRFPTRRQTPERGPDREGDSGAGFKATQSDFQGNPPLKDWGAGRCWNKRRGRGGSWGSGAASLGKTPPLIAL